MIMPHALKSNEEDSLDNGLGVSRMKMADWEQGKELNGQASR